MAADLIIILILLLFICIGVKRGIVKTLLNVAGIVITCFTASHLSNFLAKLIYETFLKQTVAGNIDSMISSSSAEYALDNCLTSLPQWANSIVTGVSRLFNGDFGRLLFDNLNKSNASLVSKSAEYIKSVVQELCVSVFGLILLIVLFIVIFILVRKLIKRISRICKLPILKQINGFFGGLLGVVYGIIIVLLAVNIFYLILNLSSPQLFQNDLINGSLFKLFCIFN